MLEHGAFSFHAQRLVGRHPHAVQGDFIRRNGCYASPEMDRNGQLHHARDIKALMVMVYAGCGEFGYVAVGVEEDLPACAAYSVKRKSGFLAIRLKLLDKRKS